MSDTPERQLSEADAKFTPRAPVMSPAVREDTSGSPRCSRRSGGGTSPYRSPDRLRLGTRSALVPTGALFVCRRR